MTRSIAWSLCDSWASCSHITYSLDQEVWSEEVWSILQQIFCWKFCIRVYNCMQLKLNVRTSNRLDRNVLDRRDQTEMFRIAKISNFIWLEKWQCTPTMQILSPISLFPVTCMVHEAVYPWTVKSLWTGVPNYSQINPLTTVGDPRSYVVCSGRRADKFRAGPIAHLPPWHMTNEAITGGVRAGTHRQARRI